MDRTQDVWFLFVLKARCVHCTKTLSQAAKEISKEILNIIRQENGRFQEHCKITQERWFMWQPGFSWLATKNARNKIVQTSGDVKFQDVSCFKAKSSCMICVPSPSFLRSLQTRCLRTPFNWSTCRHGSWSFQQSTAFCANLVPCHLSPMLTTRLVHSHPVRSVLVMFEPQAERPAQHCRFSFVRSGVIQMLFPVTQWKYLCPGRALTKPDWLLLTCVALRCVSVPLDWLKWVHALLLWGVWGWHWFLSWTPFIGHWTYTHTIRRPEINKTSIETRMQISSREYRVSTQGLCFDLHRVLSKCLYSSLEPPPRLHTLHSQSRLLNSLLEMLRFVGVFCAKVFLWTSLGAPNSGCGKALFVLFSCCWRSETKSTTPSTRSVAVSSGTTSTSRWTSISSRATPGRVWYGWELTHCILQHRIDSWREMLKWTACCGR